MNLLFVVGDLTTNALGRAYSLWLLAQELGASARVLGYSDGSLWRPLEGTKFASDCVVAGPDRVALRDQLPVEVPWADVLIAVKPMPDSLGLALAHRRRVPVLVDIDDPDVDERLRHGFDRRGRIGLVNPFKVDAGRHPLQYQRLAHLASRLPRMVGNPTLRDRHRGGVLVPHVRHDPGPPGPRDSAGGGPEVVFVGTPRAHKGVDDLRRAVAAVAADGFRLTVTATAPVDASPWERWVDETAFDEGLTLVRGADIVAIPSRPTLFASAQVPVKLLDAMLAGRAVVASDIEPIAWTLGGTGRLFAPGDPDALVGALRSLVAPDVRELLGMAARREALARFTPEVVAPQFEAALTWARTKRSPDAA